MKTRIALAIALAVAFAAPAFAQDNTQSAPAAPAANQQAAPDAQSASTDSHPAPKRAQHSRPRSEPAGSYSPAAMALTGNDPKYAAYQASDQQKSYPAVDHAHVPGDPKVIDHRGDQAPVADPTRTTITVPPSH